jgi:Zn-finger nucleic acid-binding protein
MTAVIPDGRLDCPACGKGLEPRGVRLFCDGCAGVMVTREELVEMLRSIYPDEKLALQQQLRPFGEGTRGCPQCRARMDSFELDGVVIDQCFTHGYWFDRDELQKVLQRDNTPEAFAASHRQRQFGADVYAVGLVGAMIKLAYRKLRERRSDAEERAKSQSA